MGFTEKRMISHEVEQTMKRIFKRCLQCPPTTPTCPTCASNQICSLVPQDCDTCAHMTCIDNPNTAPLPPRTNVGAISGGVVGSVVVVAVVVFFVWRFWIKKRREQQELEAEEWEEDDIARQKRNHNFNTMHTDTLSTRTRGSLATSILSRASNIIQIAYIPGVTNRGGSGRNSLLSTAPVPPVPAALRGSGSQPPRSPLSNEGDALFFRPGDLRDSSYSATSSLRSETGSGSGNRDTQYTRQSITPSLARSSVASELYRDEVAANPIPATTVMRAAPRVVAVKPSQSAHNGSASERSDGPQILVPGQLHNSASMRGKATQVTLGTKGKGRFPVKRPGDGPILLPNTYSKHAPAVSSPLAEGNDSPEEDSGPQQSLIEIMNDISASTSSQPVESPFFDPSEHPQTPKANPYATLGSSINTSSDGRQKRSGKGLGGLSAVIEEATNRESEDRTRGEAGAKGRRDVSPFNDEHALE